MTLRRMFAAAVVAASHVHSAHSLPLSQFNPQDTLTVYVSGASAQDNALERLFRLQCHEGTLDIYRAGGNQRVFFCSIRASDSPGVGGVTNFPDRQKVALFKTSVGGSGNGVGPLLLEQSLRFINIVDLRDNFTRRCAAEKRVEVPAAPPFDGYVEHQCVNPHPLMRVPDAGLSDVEPRIFAQNFNFTKAHLRQLTVKSANAFIFGVPVTLALRNALQAAQFAPTSPCHPDNPGYTQPVEVEGFGTVTNAETEECMPGLTRSQLSGIFGGTLTEWRQITNLRGYPMAYTDTDTGEIITPPSVAPPSDDYVYVCRRVDTSGTQASYEMFFLNQRCSEDVDGFAKPSRTVAMGTGTSDVKFCLNTWHERDLWAVGIFSTENVPDLEKDHWRFIKMDRYAPTLLNTFNGHWPFFVEQTIQWRNTNSDNPLEGLGRRLIDNIAEQAGNPIVIRTINLAFRHSWGDAGVMALNTNGHRPPLPTPDNPVDDLRIRKQPVLALSRATLGFPNNCNPPMAVFPTPAP